LKEGKIEVFFVVLKSFETLNIFFVFFSFFANSFIALGFLFFGIVLFTIMASTFDAQSIEKLYGNNFHMWKMKMEVLMHEKDLQEITSRELLPPDIEFGEIVI